MKSNLRRAACCGVPLMVDLVLLATPAFAQSPLARRGGKPLTCSTGLSPALWCAVSWSARFVGELRFGFCEVHPSGCSPAWCSALGWQSTLSASWHGCSRPGGRLSINNEDAQLNSDLAVCAGFAKPRETPQGAVIYLICQVEAASIRARGGNQVYAPQAKDRSHAESDGYARRQAQVAAENGLEVVSGKTPLPDLRIEYATREGEMAKVDLALASDHYKASQLAEKAGVGFIVYSEGGGSKAEDREYISEILSL